MVRRISILGSTGSIGANTLDVIRSNPERFKVASLSCGSSLELFLRQIEEFSPTFVSVSTEDLARSLIQALPSDNAPAVFWGAEGHRRCIEEAKPEVLMSAMMGTHGLQATLQAIQQNTAIVGVANKEILVMAGPFILSALKLSSSQLIPVDSEHSAIFQALMGNERKSVKNLILTASGGPFRTRDRESFARITRDEALKHPNWSMGAKITIDSATMMNKGLEFIEAIRLFDLPADKVKIIVHPESIIHSLVEYVDGSFMAQLGISDMRIPISLALGYPHRVPLSIGKTLNLVDMKALHFEEPDDVKFPCLRLAREAEALGPHGPVVLNAANEVAVQRFLKDEIQFMEIPLLVETALKVFDARNMDTLEAVIDFDLRVQRWARDWTSPYRRETPSHETISL